MKIIKSKAYKVGDIFLFDERYKGGGIRFAFIGIITKIGYVRIHYKIIHTYDEYHKKGKNGQFEYESNMYNYSKVITEEEMLARLL